MPNDRVATVTHHTYSYGEAHWSGWILFDFSDEPPTEFIEWCAAHDIVKEVNGPLTTVGPHIYSLSLKVVPGMIKLHGLIAMFTNDARVQLAGTFTLENKGAYQPPVASGWIGYFPDFNWIWEAEFMPSDFGVGHFPVTRLDSLYHYETAAQRALLERKPYGIRRWKPRTLKTWCKQQQQWGGRWWFVKLALFHVFYALLSIFVLPLVKIWIMADNLRAARPKR